MTKISIIAITFYDTATTVFSQTCQGIAFIVIGGNYNAYKNGNGTS
ncbi:hypothetical protein [Flavobacterium sp. GT3R68]|nr:hypothetical protein [Flavobacterium sp. GT3R68]